MTKQFKLEVQGQADHARVLFSVNGFFQREIEHHGGNLIVPVNESLESALKMRDSASITIRCVDGTITVGPVYHNFLLDFDDEGDLILYDGLDRFGGEIYPEMSAKHLDRRRDIRVNDDLLPDKPDHPDYDSWKNWHFGLKEGHSIEFGLDLFRPADLLMFLTKTKASLNDLESILLSS